MYCRASCLLFAGQRTTARNSLREALRVAPLEGSCRAELEELLDGIRAADTQKDLGNTAFKAKSWDAAAQHYDAAVRAENRQFAVDADFSASLFCNRAAAKHKQVMKNP